MGLEGGVRRKGGGVLGRSCSGQREDKEEEGTGQEDGVIGHLVERRVGSEAVGGGGGPRRSRSSM